MTSGVTERDRAKADRQAAILHEAARLFAERGYSGVSLEDLGAAVGVSGPAVYRHFENKQALLGAILVRVSERLRARRRGRHPCAGPRSREPPRGGPPYRAPAPAGIRRAVDRHPVQPPRIAQ